MSLTSWVYPPLTGAKSNNGIKTIISLAVVTWVLCFSQIKLVSAAGIQTNSSAEAWVLKQILAGQEADLAGPSTKFPQDSDRVLSASFLDQLLTYPSHSAIVHRHGIRIRHAVFQEEINLPDMEVAVPVKLAECHFMKKVDLHHSVFKKDLSLYGSTFQEADFSQIKVGGNISLAKATVTGLMNFGLANIAGWFTADEARFTNPEQESIFWNMKVGGGVFLVGAEFAGGVNFGLADIAGSFEAHEARFTNSKQGANFVSMKVGSHADFVQAKFAGPVHFSLANIAGPFFAEDARFTSSKETVSFFGMKVGDFASFFGAEFAGQVLFSSAIINSNFTMSGARFTDPNAIVVFDGVKVGGTANFTDTEFKGSFVLRDMTYQDIRVGLGESVIALIDRSGYSVIAYNNLEAYFKRLGYAATADRVFIAQKHRERVETLPWYTIGYWWNWFLFFLVAYGRKPFYALVWCSCFVALGYCVFRKPEDMQVQNDKFTDETYSPFWYSLGLFLPFVNLYVADVWIPKKECLWARWYRWVHILLGWILIPIGLASITGLIR